jgi:maltose O-acetyltransferase
MMTEKEKMRAGMLFSYSDKEILAECDKAHQLSQKYNLVPFNSEESRLLIKKLIPNIPDTTQIMPPIFCDHGNGIHLGEHVFINAGSTFLDDSLITIGSHTLVGPNASFYTPIHPSDYLERRKPQEYSKPITIGCDCWIGGSVTILPGITIGDRVIIGAGSVVTHDIPSDTTAAGNPCRIIKQNRNN